MSRPLKCRRVQRGPLHTFYKPQGIPLEGLTGVNLSVEGFEALRLADAETLEHAAAAEKMGVSRPTFSRILNEARSIVARALVNGWAIHIDGGSYRLDDADAGKPDIGPNPGAGSGRRRKQRGS